MKGLGPIHRPVLTLDFGSTTGWALCAFEGRIISGAWHYRPAPSGHPGGVFAAFHPWLTGLVRDTQAAHIVYEIPFHRAPGRRAAVVLIGMEAITLMVAQVRSLPIDGLNASNIKKAVTGKGNAKKPEVAAALRARRLMPAGAGEDEVDALALLLVVMESH